MNNQSYVYQNIGQYLMKSVTFELNGTIIQKHSYCHNCHKLFECTLDEKFEKKYNNRINKKKGDVVMCADCDTTKIKDK